MGPDLTERQKDVLMAIVTLYIKNQKPVSSDDVLSNTKMNTSSATVRNDMQKLQHLKYIFQQHTSGGRIPTDRAVKLYFDVVKELYSNNSSVLDIPKEYKFYDLNLMFENVSKMISNTLESLVIFEYPNPRYLYITRAVVTPVTESHCVITLLTSLGLTISRTMEIYDLPHPKELESLLNKGLTGKSLSEVFSAVKLQSVQAQDERVVNMFKLVEGLVNEFSRIKYTTNGFDILISKNRPPIESIEMLACIVGNDKIKEELFRNLTANRDINLCLGNELVTGETYRQLKNFAFFYTSYCNGVNPVGRIFVITNKFSDYEKNYKVINEYTSRFSEIISKNL
ncbi:MAG TPA: hypothetical protein PK315_11895 [Petrotogaceae bacterium]|jgi:heat-inducible transcriptional repressor|nr:hypothetical protein [Petrotogaceae bacterium]HPO28171.1 hypothetical protein [Petrotogaceae bacterium]